ncbi:MAG: di-trans,poly-cis-decaprenylcistransferase [Aquificae bacterium]|nr:di-trans,poly-cis-decaprenylcistransferase [Aquificota bacterium]
MKLPRHVAIIMDGNGRWALKRGLPRVAGHYRGAQTAEKVVELASRWGIEYLTLYAFSTENWRRPKEEVEALFSLLEEYLKSKRRKLEELNVRVRFIGRRDRLPKSLVELMKQIEQESKDRTGLKLYLAVDYGARDEILRAVRKLLESPPELLTEESFRSYLDLNDAPDPDLLIRTGGEQRLSNFLLWYLAYTELYFTETLWPDFNEEEFKRALEEFASRERRFGGI